jgi:hypothetical protein
VNEWIVAAGEERCEGLRRADSARREERVEGRSAQRLQRRRSENADGREERMEWL